MEKTKEMQFYEAIGIKQFRKMAFGLCKAIWFPLALIRQPKNREAFYQENIINYYMKKGKDIKKLKDFKKMLLVNAGLHIYSIIDIMKDVPAYVKVGLTKEEIAVLAIAMGINTYCIMLQRYNQLRINQVIKKHEEIMQKKALSDEQAEDKTNDNIYLFTNYQEQAKGHEDNREFLKEQIDKIIEYESLYNNQSNYDVEIVEMVNFMNGNLQNEEMLERPKIYSKKAIR